MRSRKHAFPKILILISSFAATGCGLPPPIEPATRRLAQTEGQQQDDGGIDVTPTPSGTPAPTGPIGSATPAERFEIYGRGDDTHVIQVRTRRILKVQFAPGAQDRTITGTGYSPQYSKASVRVEVSGNGQTTPLLHNGVASTAQKSIAMDFGSFFTRTCSDSDTSCRQTVSITIRLPRYDFQCFSYGTYCSSTAVHDNYPWNGVIYVQTDDTQAL